MGSNKPAQQNSIQTKKYKEKQDWIVIRWMLILRPAIVTSTLGAAILVIPKGMIDKTPIIIIVLGTYLLTLLFWFAHRLSGIHRPLIAMQIAFDIFITTGIVHYTGIHYTGGMDSSFVGFYFLSIMCASLFFRRLITFLFATQAVFFYVSYNIFYLYYFRPSFDSSFNPDVVENTVFLEVFLYSIVMYAVGFLSSNYAERIIKKDTALLSALKLLKEAKLDTSDILQSMSNGLITITMTGLIVYINRAAEQILELEGVRAEGRKYSEVLGDRASEMVTFIHKQLARATGGAENNITVIDRKGHPVPLGLTAAPLYDPDRSRRGIIINFKDLIEKNKLIEMIRQSDRMAAIGELSAAIAHEIRNPLASICNAVELLKEDFVERDPRMVQLLHVIDKESERLQRISTDFLEFARVKGPKISRLNLKTLIDEVLILIENDPRNTESICINSRIDTAFFIRFDEDHFKQIIINILINSIEALDGTGEITIEVETMKESNDKYIRLVIYDTGPGFPENSIDHVFEPFFSTKKEGTGLGLALVRKLIISNHGRVFARNRDNSGAEIALYIPFDGEK
jgi:two-component system sensor histidine kinase PilS (NtrC family)